MTHRDTRGPEAREPSDVVQIEFQAADVDVQLLAQGQLLVRIEVRDREPVR